MHHPKTWLAAAGAALVLPLLLAGGLRADVLQLKDGRIIEGKPLERVQGGVRIKFENGEVVVPDELINDVIIFNPDGTFQPRNAEEAEKLEKGFMPYQGKWIPKARYEHLRKKEIEEYRARAEEARNHKEWRFRYQQQTRNFAFEYTIPKETGQEFMDLFETYFATFTKEWGVQRGRLGKLKVCFYHNRDYFHQVSGAPGGVLGYFRFVDPIELNVYNIRNDKEMTLGVIFHEVNHYLLHLIDPKFSHPPWVGEGLAEYYGCSKWDPEKKKLTTGHLQEGRLVSLQDDIDQGEWFGIEEMINTEQAILKHYTWGWAFCHFLLETPRYAKPFKKFVRDLAASRAIKKKPLRPGIQTVDPKQQIDALKKYLGVKDIKDLEQEWHGYIKNNLKSKTARGYMEAARIAERNNLPLTAEEYYQKAIAAGCKMHRCFYDYGHSLWERDKYQEAIEQFKKALEIDPLDAYSYLYIGRAYADMGGKDNKEKAKRYYDLAREIDPYDDNLEDLLLYESKKTQREFR
ncbi:MAG: tetratricopeptide repeat protein [Planctomycetes bacterium]|nr:tetratricopeptide repeat protein [Planctomycetota bacterium]